QDHLVDPVAELRGEAALELASDVSLHLIHLYMLCEEAEGARQLTEVLGPKVRGHDDDGVAQIHPPSASICQLNEPIRQTVMTLRHGAADGFESRTGADPFSVAGTLLRPAAQGRSVAFNSRQPNDDDDGGSSRRSRAPTL